jgi:tartrate-resistant acid phosphatase type 5
VLASLLALSSGLVGCDSRAGGEGLVRPATPPATTAATSGASIAAAPALTASSPPTTFAIIGDYGTGGVNEGTVASMVASRNPDFVITTGDNYYSEAGGTGTDRFERAVGAFYGRWMKEATRPATSTPEGPALNAFFPSLGNHDYTDATPALKSYLSYFKLPGADFANTSGNERYYDFVNGPVHFFVLNSNKEEPAGTRSDSKQARWLKRQLAASTSPWNIVYFHHPPYASDGDHGSTPRMQWPFAKWGADAVIAGHAHSYERVMRDGIVYFVNGSGGRGRYPFGVPVDGSASRYVDDWGAQIVTATETTLDFGFYNTRGELIDSWSLSAEPKSAN